MRIHVVHAIAHTQSSYGIDHDGLTAALDLIGREHEVRWLNVHPYNADHREREREIPDADVVLARSDWGWLPDQAVERALRGRVTPAGLLVAGSSPPPPLAQMLRFDVLFYETPWYAPFVAHHPFAVEAFGVDTDAMHDHGRTERSYTWVMVGRLADFKRPERLLAKQGRRIALGDFSVARPEIEQRLRDDGVELVDQVPYERLAEIYNDAEAVLVPCVLQGGGERAVLEGRACGCRVEIAEDNPKLASLLEPPVRNHREYAATLLDAMTQVVDGGRRVPPQDKLAAQRVHRRAVVLDKARRAPSTVLIRARNLVRGTSARARPPAGRRGPSAQ